MYQVLVEGLELYAYHGVPDAEREIGHRYLIDLRLEVDGTATETDDISGTVDYAAAVRIARDTTTGEQYRTVERLAAVIGQRILAAFESTLAVEVTVRKPLPPAPFIAASAGVSVFTERRQEDLGGENAPGFLR